MFVIKVQSLTDIITNSSTEIFCIANNTKLFRDFLNNVLHLLDPNVNIDQLVTIEIIPDMEKIQDFIEYSDDWFIDFLEEHEIDKDHLRNALDMSSSVNLAPVDAYLKQFNFTYPSFCAEIQEKLYNDDRNPIEGNYALVPINDNVNMDLIYKINKILEGFADRVYDITERYN